MIKFGVEILPTITIDKIVDTVIAAENLGIDHIWVTDHYCNRNVYAILTVLAQKTQRVILGVGVTNPYDKHPAWTASAIATIAELTGGRAALGIGAGDRATLESIGLKWEKPLVAVREAVTIIRKLLEGETVTFEGTIFKLKNAKLNYKPPKVPIYIGAQAPRMLKLAGSIGDGVLINVSHHEMLSEMITHVKEGIKESGRDEKAVDIAACTALSISTDREKAVKAAKPVVAFIVAGTSDEILKKYGIDVGKANEIRTALAKGDFGTATGKIDDRMLEYFSITGTLDQCLDRINELIKRGVTQIVFGSPLGPSKKEALDLIGKIIKELRK